MGAIDKFLNNLNLGNSSSAEDEYYDDYDDEVVEEQPKKFSKLSNDDNTKRFSKVSNIGRKKNGASYEINVVKPTSMEDSKQIVDSLLNNMAVLLNLTLVDVDLARRVLDFSLGSIYTIDGSYQKITDTIFVFVPNGVDISGSVNDDGSDN